MVNITLITKGAVGYNIKHMLVMLQIFSEGVFLEELNFMIKVCSKHKQNQHHFIRYNIWINMSHGNRNIRQFADSY